MFIPSIYYTLTHVCFTIIWKCEHGQPYSVFGPPTTTHERKSLNNFFHEFYAYYYNVYYYIYYYYYKANAIASKISSAASFQGNVCVFYFLFGSRKNNNGNRATNGIIPVNHVKNFRVVKKGKTSAFRHSFSTKFPIHTITI